MSEEETISSELTEQFPFLKDQIRIQRTRRLFAAVPAERIADVFDYAVKKAGFSILCTITGLDQGGTLGVIYHLARENGVMLNLTVSVPRDAPVLQTVTGYFPAAENYEREMVDLLGMQVRGLREGSRYPLPDNWPANQYPLRKEWKADSLDAASPAGSEVSNA